MGLDLVAIRRQFHQIPELGFQEFKTQALILAVLDRFEGKENMTIKTWETGVLVKVSGKQPTRTIAYRADIDGLPITEETGYLFHSKHEGQMHACGHDFHMTIALGVVDNLLQHRPDNDVVIIFQPAEEGPGGALPLLQSDAFKAWYPDEIFALHVAPEYSTGMVAIREGLLFANTSELFIDFKGKGGHAAYPHLANDMVVAASHFITQIQSIISRRLDPLSAGVVTIGKMTSGTKQNIIADSARVEGTLRALSPQTMQLLKKAIQDHVAGIETAFSCTASIDFGSNYHQVVNHSEQTQAFMRYCREHNYDVQICKEAMTGEDFGYFLKEIPGFMFWLGVSSESGLHDACFQPDEAALEIAVELVTNYIRRSS